MSKTTLIIGAGIVAIVGMGLLIYFTLGTTVPGKAQPNSGTITSPRTGNTISTQSQDGGSNSVSAPLPKFTADPNKFVDNSKKLTFEERERLSLLIGNMAGVTQTYGYEDYNGINGVADYFTTPGQAALQNYVNGIKQNTQLGYRQYGVADSTAQILFYNNAKTNTYTATVYTIIYNLSDLKNPKISGHQIVEFELIRQGSGWKFNNISSYTK